MLDKIKEEPQGVAVLLVLRPDGFLLFQWIALKCVVVCSTVIVVPLKNALVGMLADAKLKTLTTGLYYEVNDRVRLLFCKVIR